MSCRPLFVTRKFPPSVGGMETLADGVWRSLVSVSPGAVLLAHGGSNRQLPRWLPGAVLRVFWLLLRRKVDFVLAGDAPMYACLFPLLRLFRVANATMVMGLDLTYDHRAYRALVYPALRRAPRVIAISAATAAAARSVDVPAARIGVVRLGVSVPEVGADHRAAASKEIRQRYGLPDGAVVLLTLGRLVRRKGARWFTRYVLPGLPPDITYLVAGDGPEANPIRVAAVQAGLGDRVLLLGRVDDDTRELLLRGADLFVQPNIRVPGDIEGFGLVTIEASMRGTPVAASGIEGILDAVVDGETGTLLPPEDSDAWVRQLNELTTDTERLVALGARHQVRTRELYGEEVMARHLMAEIAHASDPSRTS